MKAEVDFKLHFSCVMGHVIVYHMGRTRYNEDTSSYIYCGVSRNKKDSL